MKTDYVWVNVWCRNDVNMLSNTGIRDFFSFLASLFNHLSFILFFVYISFYSLYLFRPYLPLCCPLHILVLISSWPNPILFLTPLAFFTPCVYISLPLFISLQLPSSFLHPLKIFLFIQPSPLISSFFFCHFYSTLLFSISRHRFILSDLPRLSCPSPLLYIFAFFSACPAIECNFSSRSWAFPPWHQFVGYHDNLLSQVIYSSRSAWIPHNTGCVWTHFGCFSIYLCFCVNFQGNFHPQNLSWAICIHCVSLRFHFRPFHKDNYIVWCKVLGLHFYINYESNVRLITGSDSLVESKTIAKKRLNTELKSDSRTQQNSKMLFCVSVSKQLFANTSILQDDNMLMCLQPVSTGPVCPRICGLMWLRCRIFWLSLAEVWDISVHNYENAKYYIKIILKDTLSYSYCID